MRGAGRQRSLHKTTSAERQRGIFDSTTLAPYAAIGAAALARNPAQVGPHLGQDLDVGQTGIVIHGKVVLTEAATSDGVTVVLDAPAAYMGRVATTRSSTWLLSHR